MKNFVKILFLCFFCSFFSEKTFSQEYTFCAFGGYKYQGLSFGELGVTYSRIWGGVLPFPMYSVGVGSEFSYLDDELLLGPKIVAEGNYVFVGGRLNGTYYLNSKKEEFILTPEVGLTFFNVVNLYYGYNFRFNDKVFDRISNHRVTFSLCVPLIFFL